MVDFVLLMAGTSSRMEGENKLLLPSPVEKNKSICRVAAEQALEAASFWEGNVICVTGYEDELIKKELAGLNVITVGNPDYLNGQFSSVKCGVGKVEEGRPFFICPSDLPYVTAQHYGKLLLVYEIQDAVRPFCGDIPGHPVLLSPKFRNIILSSKDDCSVKSLLELYRPAKYGSQDPSWVTDCDTREDYSQICGN